MKPAMLLIGGATQRMMDMFHSEFDVHILSEISDFDAWAATNGEHVKAIATNGHDGVKPEVMATLPNLEVISCYGVGYDAIDTAEATRRGILVTHTPGVLDADVANLAILLILATLISVPSLPNASITSRLTSLFVASPPGVITTR